MTGHWSKLRFVKDSMNPDRLGELEEERSFLLRSITDLDREHAAGDVDDSDYAALRDGYTARAATVLRAIEQGSPAMPASGRRRPRVLAAWIVGVVAVASLSGWLVAQWSGQRRPGQEITGGQPVDAVTAKLADARAAMGSGDYGSAAQGFRAVLDIDPRNAEATTYTAWLLALSASGVDAETQALAVSQSQQLFQRVIADQPEYADAHCLFAVASGRFYPEPDLVVAREQAQLCLDNNPPSDMVPLIQSFLSSVTSSTSVSSTSVSSTSVSTTTTGSTTQP